MRCIWLIIVLATLFMLPASAAPEQEPLTAQQWRQDLQYLSDQIITVHPGAFHQVRVQDFQSAVADLYAKIPTLSDHQIEAEFVRLVALLGEGHSRLSLPGLSDVMSDVPDVTPFKNPRLAFHRLPLRFSAFPDGLFVTAATSQFKSLVGARVLRIGDHSAQDALDAVAPLINRDNDMGALLIGPEFVAVQRS